MSPMEKLRIGILREGKIPPDKRVPLTPRQCAYLIAQYPHLSIFIQPSPFRCYGDEEYQGFGLPVKEDLSDCDLLMSIKEVPPDQLLPGKKYMFFSHTIKKQPQNRSLLQEAL